MQKRRILTLSLLVGLTTAAAFAAFRITPEKGSAVLMRSAADLDWKPPSQLPPGAEYHLMREDPVNHGIQALVRFPKKYRVAEHTHSGDETIVVLKGKLVVRAGTAKRTLRAGDYAVFPKDVPHSLQVVGWRAALFYTSMSAPYDLKYLASH